MMKKHQLSRTGVIIWEIVAIVLFLCSLANIVVCGMLHDNGYGWFWWPLVGLVGFFVLDILALAILFGIMEPAVQSETADKAGKYGKTAMTRLSALTPQTITKTFLRHGFRATEDGYLRKKVFSFAKDSICYLARIVETADMEKTMEDEFRRADNRHDSYGNRCLLLFLVQSGISQNELCRVRKTMEALMIDETVIPSMQFDTAVVIPVNTETNEGLFLGMPGFSISVYHHGCRLLKKYFSPDCKAQS